MLRFTFFIAVEGESRRWCGLNALVLAREGDDETKHCQKMKRMQRARLESMKRKRDMTRQRGNVGRRRGSTGDGKGRR
jgi:hypothetical protein